jgi:glyoxylase-like metal-dependent hydrolase (beta-lactamase superfamily II)
MEVQHFFDKETSTLTYIVFDRQSSDAVIIDPVMDYDGASGNITDTSFQGLLDFINTNKLKPHFVLETHAHADHLSGAQLLKEAFPKLMICISKNIKTVQQTFKELLNMEESFRTDGSQFDKLIEDNEVIKAGTLTIKAIPTPGHTPTCLTFSIGNSVFTGDSLFIEDYGTGRCDFPQGCAENLYQSVHERLYLLPDDTEVYVGHDYQPNGRELRYKTTIGASKRQNIQLNNETAPTQFFDFRTKRDKTLNTPKLLYPSIQVNLRAGHLPPLEKNGQVFLKMPVFNCIKKK